MSKEDIISISLHCFASLQSQSKFAPEVYVSNVPVYVQSNIPMIRGLSSESFLAAPTRY